MEVSARGQAKQYLVDTKNKIGIPELLEAENTVPAHSKYLLLSELQRKEHGSVNHEELLQEWKKWVDEALVKELLRRRGACAFRETVCRESKKNFCCNH